MNLTPLIKPTRAEYVCAEGLWRFDELLTGLKREGYQIASTEEITSERVRQNEHYGPIAEEGGFVSEGFVQTKEGLFLTKKSPLVLCSKKATNHHECGREFYLSRDDFEFALSDSIKLPIGSLGSEFSLPLNRLNEDSIARYLFGKNAQAYGDFLMEHPALYRFKELKISYNGYKPYKPFVRQLWLAHLGWASEIDTRRNLTDNGNQMFGRDIEVRG